MQKPETEHRHGVILRTEHTPALDRSIWSEIAYFVQVRAIGTSEWGAVYVVTAFEPRTKERPNRPTDLLEGVGGNVLTFESRLFQRLLESVELIQVLNRQQDHARAVLTMICPASKLRCHRGDFLVRPGHI